LLGWACHERAASIAGNPLRCVLDFEINGPEAVALMLIVKGRRRPGRIEGAALGSQSLLPAHRIPAAVEAGDDRQRFIRFEDEHQSVGITAQQGAPNAFVDHGKLPGIGHHPLNHGVDGGAETPAQSGGLVLEPILRFDDLSAGGLGKDHRMH
jgi:hypothetical protein